VPSSPLTQPRALVAAAAGSFLAIVLAYALAPADAASRVLVADVSWTWAAAFAVVCCLTAARRVQEAERRRVWLWMAAGCALFLAAHLIWNYYQFVRRIAPPYPSLADVGYLGLYACFLAAVAQLRGSQPRRRFDVELLLDTVLVTLTAGALAYEFLLVELFRTGAGVAAVITSVLWSVGGIAVLWLILIELLHSTHVPLGTTGLVIPALGVLCVSNLAYATASLQGSYRPGGLLDLGWDAGFLLLAAAAALAPARTPTADTAGRSIPGRAAAVAIGSAGIAAVALREAFTPVSDTAGGLLIALAVVIVGVRFTYSLQADRRYASLLENEVASQTRSLMDSLAATAAAERNLRLVMDAVPDTIVVVDQEGRILERNDPTRAGGPLAAAPERRTVFQFLTPEAPAAVRERLAAAFRGQVQRFEVAVQRDDHTHGVSAVVYAPIREGGGSRITRVLVLARDVTDQKRTESQLQQAEKLAAMGQLVSGVAHEINNPAAIISGFAQTLLLDDLKPEQRDMLQMVYDEATRIGRITSNLLAFARAGGKQRALADLNDLTRRTFALRSYYLSTLNIAVALDLDPAEPKIWADASELQQMLLNLLINAEQALVTVEGPRAITIRTRADENEVRLEIADSGPGIPREIRDRIFDPFFTTKPEGVGTGLGLSICYGIAREHGGRIWVESEPGKGARFGVVLPRDQRLETRPTPDAPIAPPAAVGDLTVLVVDDETALRDALIRFLDRHGIHAEGVADGAEALRVLRQRGFDVIISDVRMPGMSGREFLERLRRDWPHLVSRLVFSTGDTFATDTAALLKQSGVPTVTKPYDLTALERVIRETASRAAAAESPKA
jgi:PAS domain S-box-containing protein